MDSREPPSLRFASLLEEVWRLLADGQRLRQSPFHQAVLATSTARGPSARYVVLRQVDRERGMLGFHTDRRSDKWTEIERDPRVALCFHGHNVQVRVEGRAILHHDDAVADLAWKRTGLMSRRCYLADPAPGTVTPKPTSGLPAHLSKDRPNEAESAGGRVNFGVVIVPLQRIEWLHLAFEGHRRARLARTGAGPWRGEWLVP
ncbi:MAG TPA: pyridoxamine 5'-phosphate oxidase [Xanthomonadaceae bacterium]|jgi:pyridoxine/pyridoxamine 5'-phosphate oxidase|nr:pyridoxamine 5'-phosphate oxidase [Xanthomonadaceae bacterium]